MSGTDYTRTPNHNLYLPIYDMDEGQWGGHINSNTTALDTLLATTGTTTFLPINGGTMNGKLTLFSAPSAAMDAATKGYVDGLLTGAPFMPLSGGTMTGMLTLFSDPAGALDAVTKQYADKMLPLAGGAMTGPITLTGVNTAPTAAPGTNTTQIASTAFVAAAVTAGVGAYLPLAGGTVTGTLNLTANYGSQIIVGGTGQGGRIDFKRGTDGAIAGYVGMSAATIGNSVTLWAAGGGSIVNINASDASAGTISLQIGGTQKLGVAASGVTLPTVTGATTFSAAGTALTVTNNASIGGTLTATGGIAIASMTTSMTAWLNSLPTAPQATAQWWNNGGSPVYS
jgi:hypothetical protein